MASNGKDEGGALKEHNVADINALIRNCAQEMGRIKEQRKELNEQAGDIRVRLRESGVNTKAFEFACRVLEQEVEARNEYLDQLRVNFEALGVGAQAEMFPAASKGAPDFVGDATEAESVAAAAE